MKLKSFGCSFIFGTDLPDNPETLVRQDPVGQYSRLTWPALIAKELGMEYECLARPGSGNLQIAERVLNDSTADLVVVDWSWVDRFDYVKSADPWQPWGTLRPSEANEESRLYYKHLHSEYRDKLVTLLYIRTVIDTLTAKSIPFIMTYEDDLMFDQRWHTSPAVAELQNYIQPHMTTFNGQTFLNWSRSLGYPESATQHPLEQAHRSAADLILTAFDRQKIVGLTR